ncbi:hypothetical protein V8C34DRAFT_276428, partial [Trichoderma compactum]
MTQHGMACALSLVTWLLMGHMVRSRGTCMYMYIYMSLYVYPQCDEYEEMTSACIDTSNDPRSKKKKKKKINFKSKRQCALFCCPIVYHIPGLAKQKRNVQYKM